MAPVYFCIFFLFSRQNCRAVSCCTYLRFVVLESLPNERFFVLFDGIGSGAFASVCIVIWIRKGQHVSSIAVHVFLLLRELLTQQVDNEGDDDHGDGDHGRNCDEDGLQAVALLLIHLVAELVVESPVRLCYYLGDFHLVLFLDLVIARIVFRSGFARGHLLSRRWVLGNESEIIARDKLTRSV